MRILLTRAVAVSPDKLQQSWAERAPGALGEPRNSRTTYWIDPRGLVDHLPPLAALPSNVLLHRTRKLLSNYRATRVLMFLTEPDGNKMKERKTLSELCDRQLREVCSE
jgi:hypothetical protein